MHTNRQIWKVSYPILLSLLAQNIINITDTAFLGRVGEVELGASALAGVYYMAIYMLGFGFSTGSQILIARRNGEGRHREIGSIMMQGILFLLCLSSLIVGLTSVLSPPIMSRLIHSTDVYDATMKFLDYRIYGLFFAFVNVMFRAFYVGVTRTKVLTVNAIVMSSTNVVLNYVLIFGKFGFPELGIAGAALASVISEAVSVVFFIVYTLRTIDFNKYGFFAAKEYNPKLLLRILDVSIWTMIQSFLALGTWFLFFIAMEHLNERSLAVSNMVRSVSTLLFMPVSAFATTANTLVSNLMGEGKQDQVMKLVWKVTKICWLCLLPLMLLFIFFPVLTMRIYTEDLTLIQSSIASLFVLTSAYLIVPPASIFFNALSGTGNTRSALWIETLTLIAYMAYVWLTAYVFKASVAVCWTSEHVYWILLLIFSVFYFIKANWQNKKI